MRARIWLAVLAVLLAAGCAEEAPTVAVPADPRPPVAVAAASSGGACRLLDFAVIAEHTGGEFDVAAATERGDTHTCVVRAAGAVLPELTLSVTETSIDAATFTLDVQPSGATKITKLGKAGYRRTLPRPRRRARSPRSAGWPPRAGSPRCAGPHPPAPPRRRRTRRPASWSRWPR